MSNKSNMRKRKNISIKDEKSRNNFKTKEETIGRRTMG